MSEVTLYRDGLALRGARPGAVSAAGKEGGYKATCARVRVLRCQGGSASCVGAPLPRHLPAIGTWGGPCE